jgi:hypothetical protein
LSVKEENIIRENMIKNRSIFVQFRKEGIHKYPAAATDPKLESVSFLGSPHRHIFHFRVTLDVFHNDRDVEFIMFKRELEGLYGNGTLQMDFQSCEMLAESLIEYISKKYTGRNISVEVSEDGENGATLEYTPGEIFEDTFDGIVDRRKT